MHLGKVGGFLPELIGHTAPSISPSPGSDLGPHSSGLSGEGGSQGPGQSGVPLTDASIGWFLPVPCLGIELTTLVYEDDALAP